ncbi:MAG: LPS assembly lipoprotein LptE [Pseudomonadota bacterium]
MWSRRTMLLTPLVFGACGFQPVFGPGGTGRALQNRVLVQAPDNRDEFLLVQALEERLGRTDAPAYDLSLSITTVEEGLAIDRAGNTRRFNLLGSAEFTLSDMATGAVITSGTVENFVGYSATGTTVATLASEEDAQARLMRILADQIVRRLYATALA